MIDQHNTHDFHQEEPPLEDDPCDVIAKAMQGLEINQQQLLQQTGLTAKELDSALQGECHNIVLEKIALALQLSPQALVGLPHYHPAVQPPAGLHRIITPFGHAGVNAYIITVENKAIVFDTGTDASPIIRFLENRQLELDTLCITHHHHDHTQGIPDLHPARILYPEDTAHGESITLLKNHQLTSLNVSGHLSPARAYLYEELEVPVCIVGDSVFAGSMGKTPNLQRYQLSLQTARDHLMTLPTSTILCPGHGPLTSVENERLSNPFLN